MSTGNRSLPPVGPAWAGALMGTSVTAALTGVHLGQAAGRCFTMVAAGVLVLLTAGWVRQWQVSHSPGFTVTDLPAWSMVTMGVMSLASAVDATLGLTTLHGVTTTIGAVASVLVFTPQAVRLLAGTLPARFPEALPLVTPMVAATNEAQVGHPVAAGLLFTASLVAGVPAFIRVYAGTGRRPADAAAPTVWIPLGIVGQSSAAALLISGGNGAGQLYAAAVLTTGVPLALWAVAVHWPAVLRWPAPGPAWWACTFPVGTCSLGTHLLSGASGHTWLDTVSVALLAVLLVHVALATVRTMLLVWTE